MGFPPRPPNRREGGRPPLSPGAGARGPEAHCASCCRLAVPVSVHPALIRGASLLWIQEELSEGQTEAPRVGTLGRERTPCLHSLHVAWSSTPSPGPRCPPFSQPCQAGNSGGGSRPCPVLETPPRQWERTRDPESRGQRCPGRRAGPAVRPAAPPVPRHPPVLSVLLPLSSCSGSKGDTHSDSCTGPCPRHVPAATTPPAGTRASWGSEESSPHRFQAERSGGKSGGWAP